MTYEKQEEQPTCATCPLMVLGEINPNNVTERSYFCYRYPPKVVPVPAQQANGQMAIAMHSIRPSVMPNGWCGEHPDFLELDDDINEELAEIIQDA